LYQGATIVHPALTKEAMCLKRNWTISLSMMILVRRLLQQHAMSTSLVGHDNLIFVVTPSAALDEHSVISSSLLVVGVDSHNDHATLVMLTMMLHLLSKSISLRPSFSPFIPMTLFIFFWEATAILICLVALAGT
jgi:hypothetical protein